MKNIRQRNNMPLYETIVGRAHSQMRCNTLNQQQLRLRIVRIRNPQKMYEFVLELGRRETGGGNWRTLYRIAVESLSRMGYNSNGTENDNPVSTWRPATSRTATRRREAVLVERPRPAYVPPPRYKLVFARSDTTSAFSSCTGQDFKAFLNVLRTAEVPWRIIAMSLGMTVNELTKFLPGVGYTKSDIDEIMEQRSRAITTNQVRRITLRKENK